jgi:hypothetical protein
MATKSFQKDCEVNNVWQPPSTYPKGNPCGKHMVTMKKFEQLARMLTTQLFLFATICHLYYEKF